MKKLFSILLAGLMVFGMASCAADTTADSTTVGGDGTTTGVTTVKPAITTPDIGGEDDPAGFEDWELLPLDTDWHYQIFNCPALVNSAEEGTQYDPELDEMQAWLDAKGEDWYKDPDVLADMATWPTKTAPMGDRYDGLGDGNSPIGWANDAHGLICYTTFELSAEQMTWVAAAELNDIYMNVWYDNTFYIWINGTLVYFHDGEGAPQGQGGADWNDALEGIDFMDGVDIREILKEGTNEIVVSLKDGWGGREFILNLDCIY